MASKNGKARTEHVYELVVANGGFSRKRAISPLSNLQDGLFNLVYTNVINQNINIKALKNYDKGEHIYKDDTKQYWLSNLKISTPDDKIKAIVDGRICNFDKLDIVLVENGLKIYK